MQSLTEVTDNILDGFDSHRQAHHVFTDPRGVELIGTHLLMRRAGRMDDQRLGIPDIREVTCEAQRLDEFCPGRAVPVP
jgi:hypothetical protein